MSVNKLEALLDAIASLKGSSTNPDGELYQIRNPLGVLSYSRPGKNSIDEKGRRIFDTWLAGYRASAYDLGLKVNALSRAGIKKDDLLENVLRVYGIDQKLGQDQVVRFLRRALKDDSISRATPLEYFRSDSEKV